MTRKKLFLPLILIVVALGLILQGCGSSSSDGGGVTPPPTPPILKSKLSYSFSEGLEDYTLEMTLVKIKDGAGGAVAYTPTPITELPPVAPDVDPNVTNIIPGKPMFFVGEYKATQAKVTRKSTNSTIIDTTNLDHKASLIGLFNVGQIPAQLGATVTVQYYMGFQFTFDEASHVSINDQQIFNKFQKVDATLVAPLNNPLNINVILNNAFKIINATPDYTTTPAHILLKANPVSGIQEDIFYE